MSEFKKTVLMLDKTFDQKSKRHYLNGRLVVLHCHHYSSLYSQLAIDAGETALLESVSRETFYTLIKDYLEDHNINVLTERIDIAVQYYAAVGLGKMNINYLGNDSGEVELVNSHVDTGWIKKWGNYDKPVNYITAGYITGMFAAILNKPLNTFNALEVQSIVKGDAKSLFKVYK